MEEVDGEAGVVPVMMVVVGHLRIAYRTPFHSFRQLLTTMSEPAPSCPQEPGYLWANRGLY
jgi:hypothetical protein